MKEQKSIHNPFHQYSYSSSKKILHQFSFKNKTKIKLQNTPSQNYILSQIQAISIMRQKRNAPVDSMGANKNADQHQQQQIRNFQHLVSVILSVQTKDQVTFKVMKNLKNYGLNVESMCNIDPQHLKELIHSINFNNKKVTNIKKISQIIKNKYQGKVPNKYQELIKLPGIGPKIANVFLKVAYGIISGIGVDTHVHRISNRLGWVNTKNPQKTQKELQEKIPKNKWSQINILLVGFGQMICLPLNPKCGQCKLKDECKAFRQNDF